MGNEQQPQDSTISPKIIKAITCFKSKLDALESAKAQRSLLLDCTIPPSFNKDFNLNQWIHIARYVLQHDTTTSSIRQQCVPSLIKEDMFWKHYFHLVLEEKKKRKQVKDDANTEEPKKKKKTKHKPKKEKNQGIKDTSDGTAAIATTSTEDTKQSDEDDEDELYQVLLHKPLVWLYKIPANIWRGRNNKCELWNLRQPIWMGRLRIVAYNHGKHLEFQFLEKDGKLFLKSTRIKLNQITTDDDGTNPIHQYFDAYGVIDSSRYFIVWVDVPAHEGKKIPFGFGIRERLDAFDIRAAVADQMKIIRRKDSDILEDSDDSHGTEYKYNKLDVATTENRFELNDDEMISIGHDIDNIDIGHVKQELKGKKHSTILKVNVKKSEATIMNDALCLLPPPPSPPLTPKDELSHIPNIEHRIHAHE
eukprot:250649_1